MYYNGLEIMAALGIPELFPMLQVMGMKMIVLGTQTRAPAGAKLDIYLYCSGSCFQITAVSSKKNTLVK
jgi:hypothetical protein